MFFLRLYFAGKEGICKFKKEYSLLRSLWFFENKTVARPAEVADKKKILKNVPYEQKCVGFRKS